jgi:hypothetical protein
MAAEQAILSNVGQPHKSAWFLPREHGATAMLFMPIVCAAVLAREWRWSEVATLTAAFSALAAKDPMVTLARQRFIWKTRHPETAQAARWFTGWMAILIVSGLVLVFAWPLKVIVTMGLGVAVFSGLAIAVNVRNSQRSTLFQIASAVALTSSSLATSLSATGTIAPWCWWLWLLLALQATAGILVVHARLDARIAARVALRTTVPAKEDFRRAAQISLIVLVCAAVTAIVLRRRFVALALLVAVLGYGYDLRCQRSTAALKIPLTKVGQRALALSSVFASLLILGLW